jgi:hypothetical protein
LISSDFPNIIENPQRRLLKKPRLESCGNTEPTA